jgi:hypothetical protein
LKQGIRNWFNNHKPKGRQNTKPKKATKDKSPQRLASSSRRPASGEGGETALELPPIKLTRLSTKPSTREEVLLYLVKKEINKEATKKANGATSGFAWLNARNELIQQRIKEMDDEELRVLDNEVRIWNERELPKGEQFL